MSELLLQERLRAEAERRPSAPAVVMGQSTLTYAELDEASTRLGRMLRDLGCEHGDRVCMVMPKSPLSLVALYGILKAGCVYVPIDVTSPSARAGKIVTPCEPRVILYGRGSESIIDGLTRDNPVAQSAAMGWMDEAPVPDDVAPAFTMEDVDGLDASPLSYSTGPDEPAYILYTSGSTGSPKGVVISHASVEAFGEWCVRYFAIGSSERISSHPEYHFDLSVLDIYTALYSGAALHLVPPEANLLPSALAAFIRDEELTQWCSVPSVLNYMAKFDAVRQDDFPALKRVVWCGEVFPTPQLIHWMERLPHVEFTNLYGPTEATCASSYYRLPSRPESPTDAVPIGVACDGEELLVLDEARLPVPPGTIGELYIGGVGLSLGYWRDEETTRAAFIDDVQVGDRRVRLYRTGDLARVGEDGLVYFAGRADTQVKSRGYRIELGEIEAALSALSCLKESAVVAIDSPGFEGKAICCAYAPAQGVSVTHGELRSQLSEHVPKYMLPAHWKAWETLPKNENGKIDRPLLRREFQNE